MAEQVRSYTFRDAGLHSRLLRGVNAAGAGLRVFGLELPSLDPDSIVKAAVKRAGLEDFGDPGWREGLEVLCLALDLEAKLTTFGRFALRGLLVSALESRLQLVDWAARHPEVREERIEAPWIVIGLPRTGTTLLSLLLGLDPEVRPLLQWEATHPVPPPDLATHAEDPRIAVSAKQTAQLQALNPAIRAMHPMGATLATECVGFLFLDLRSLLIETQACIPTYGSWLEKTDMRGAYAMHRLALQVLQSRIPTPTWSLKTPQHLWHLDTMLEFYPDARIVWTHRDPAKVVPSVASLNLSLQKLNTSRGDPLAVGRAWDDKLHLAVMRGIEFDDRHHDEAWCHHLQYADLMADPIAAVRALYAHFGRQVSPLHARRMEAWMRERHQEVHGRHVYDPADFGLTLDSLAERYAEYRARFSVPEERSPSGKERR
jgi:Sulfotransferase family